MRITMEKKSLMPLSEFNERVSTIMDVIKLHVYIRGVKKHPGIGFKIMELKDTEYIKSKEDFLSSIRALIEHELKRYYDVVPDWD